MDKTMQIQLELLSHTGFNITPVDELPPEARGRRENSPRARNWDAAKWFVMQYPNQWFTFQEEDNRLPQISQFRKEFKEEGFEVYQRLWKMYVRYVPKEES